MFAMRNKGSFLLPGSLDPPVLPTPMPERCPAWALLDTAAYIADRKNGTFAGTTTRTNQAVGVSFWLAEPPAVSHLCVHCPGMKVTDFLDEPLVVCSGKDMAVIRVAYARGARPVERVQDMGLIDIDYLVYRVLDGNPSLQVLPNPKPVYFDPNEIGFLPSDGGDFYLAVVHPRRVLLQYDLHIFSSKTNRWTTSLALLEPPSPKHKTEYLLHQTDRVIAVGGSLLGWVDLWRGIMLCDVLDSAPVLHYIQFPMPMDGNIGRYYLKVSARAVRDVSSSNGFIKLIELEESMGLADDGRPPNGWTAVSWKTKAHCKIWTKNHEAYVDASSILHVQRQKYPEISAPEAPAVVGPLWSMHDDDIFYLMSKANVKDQYGIAITVNMMKNTVEDVTSFPAERLFFFKHAYHPFALSRPVNMTLDGCKGTVPLSMRHP